MKRRCMFVLGLCGPALLTAQTFDLDQFDQLFRPRLRLEGRNLPTVMRKDRIANYEDRSATAVFTFPLHSRFDVNAKLDLTADNLAELIKNGLRVRASQVMGSVRYGAREVSFNRENGDVHMLHTASAGALGISLTRKFRVLFWSANVNISEEDRTIDQAVPRFSGLIGQMKVRGLRRQFFFGIAASYSDGLTLPVPFVGGSAPMGKKWSFNYVLPLQLSFAWSASGRTKLNIGAGLDGSRSGYLLGDERANLNYSGLRGFLNLRHRLSPHFALRAEAGYMLAHRMSRGYPGEKINAFPLEPGPVVMVGVNVLFGQSILDRLLDGVLRPGTP